jgi:hypothetical protein
MVKCSHCGKDLERNVFCNASCKTMFHRQKYSGRVSSVTERVVGKSLIDHATKVATSRARDHQTCKHGSPKILCKLCIGRKGKKK